MVKDKKENFIINRIKSTRYALKGFVYLITREKAVKVHLFAVSIFVVFGLYFNLKEYEWVFQILALGLILATEGVNTAVEYLCDFVHPDFHDKIGIIKDVSAGAVTFAVISAYSSLVIIYYPYFYALFSQL